ncbi:MAG: MotA/TolQ/ExbB proton channel family protein [Oscillospiraceae bacterium]|nr:MotA/TolQ/ExbB proton channel family protein [Oscillospiraceae bacterium]
MNITIIIGWIGSFAAIIISILIAGELIWFADAASLFVVVVGSIFAMFATITPTQMKSVGKYFKFAIFPPKFDPIQYIKELVEYATIARSKGLLALEESANNAKDPFMKQALMLIVDANDPDKGREMLESAVDHTAERHQKGADFFAKGVTFGPAFGMMGTVVGLVSMLQVMGEDPGAMGTKMATAVITTLYGSIMSNVICAPLESALRNAHGNEELCMNIIIEGVMAIAAGSNPRFIQEKLEFMLPRTGRGDPDKGKAK